MNKTLHLVYAVPDSANPLLYRIDKYAHLTGLFPPSYRNANNAYISWPDPLLAPYSITYHLIHSFRNKFKVKLYSHKEEVEIRMEPDDILVFYPPADRTVEPWLRPDKNKVGFKLFNRNKNNKAFIIAPYNNDPVQVSYYRSLLQVREVKFIAVCGKFWIDNWQSSPLKDVLKKEDVLHVNMAIDSASYPTIKKRFNKKGERKFLYVGSCKKWKNTSQLTEIAKMMNAFKGGYISDGEILGWEKISDWRNLDLNFMKKVVEEYDFFLNCSVYDAQATTILEQMSYGVPVACTPESGYTYPSIFKLDKFNTKVNCQILEKLQYMEEEDLFAISQINKEIVNDFHNWRLFTEKISKYING